MIEELYFLILYTLLEHLPWSTLHIVFRKTLRFNAVYERNIQIFAIIIVGYKFVYFACACYEIA